MEPVAFWNTYVEKREPADFVWYYGKGNPQEAVEEYLRQRPTLFGIVRRATWRETFLAKEQYSHTCVRTGLVAYLEGTESEWRPRVEEARREAIRLRAEAKARAEAEALALAVARVEAEARARAEAERLKAAASAPQESAPEADKTVEGASIVPNNGINESPKEQISHESVISQGYEPRTEDPVLNRGAADGMPASEERPGAVEMRREGHDTEVSDVSDKENHPDAPATA